MNTVCFKAKVDSLQILVDGRDLVEIVREAESASAAGEPSAKLAGSYAGLDLFDAPTMRDLLLGRGVPEWSPGGRVALLICECRCPGCWDLTARIDVAELSVRWSAFRQPNRPMWQHDRMMFEFERVQYDVALARLCDTLRPGFGR